MQCCEPEPSEGCVLKSYLLLLAEGLCLVLCIFLTCPSCKKKWGNLYHFSSLSLSHTSHCHVCSRCPALLWILYFRLITSFIAAIGRWWVVSCFIFFLFFLVLLESLLKAETYTHTKQKTTSHPSSTKFIWGTGNLLVSIARYQLRFLSHFILLAVSIKKDRTIQ